MECPVCLVAFDLQGVRPKALPCGHTVCQSCVGGLQQCPMCRKAFAVPVPDNFSLVAHLDALQLERPRGSWWCMDCNSPAASQCVEEHSVRRLKAALRLGLQDVVPRASQALQGLQDGLQGLQDGAALTALRLLRGPPATCRLTLRQDDGEAFGAEWRVDGEGAEDSLLQTLVVALAASGRLLQQVQQPSGVQEDAPPAAQQPAEDCVGALDSGGSSSTLAGRRGKQETVRRERRRGEPSGVHADAPPAAQQPAEDRIEELDLDHLCCRGPAARREDKAETLRLVRQRGVRRMTNVWCDEDPDWVLDVLRSAAPTLEVLQVWFAREAHLAAVHGMPRLQRMEWLKWDQVGPRNFFFRTRFGVQRPVELPALPQPTCLRWLRVEGLPRATTVSLLRAHAASLDVLWLGVGSEPGGEWPYRCAGLQALLGQCGLRLTRLVLWRNRVSHGSSCRAQLEAVRRVLPACTVLCDDCDGVPYEHF